MSKLNTNLLFSYKKGYRVTKEGRVIGVKGKFLSSIPLNRAGYHFFSIRYNEERRIILTHRLQAYQKFGDKIFEEGIMVRHLNGDPRDNSWDNIAIGTQSDNMMDIPKEISLRTGRNASSFVKIHNHEDIIKDRKKGMTYSELMKKYNISSKGTISFIINKSIKAE